MGNNENVVLYTYKDTPVLLLEYPYGGGTKDIYKPFLNMIPNANGEREMVEKKVCELSNEGSPENKYANIWYLDDVFQLQGVLWNILWRRNKRITMVRLEESPVPEMELELIRRF